MADINIQDARAKFHVHKAGAKKRGIEFLITFEDWLAWWSEDGRWARRGRGKGKLVMARIGDSGPYHISNVWCATHAGNMGDIPKAAKTAQGKLAHKRRKARGIKNLLDFRGKRHPRSKSVITPDGLFESGCLAADHYGITSAAIYWRIKKGKFGFRYEEARKP